MRWLALVFVLLIAALQYPMWLGKGGWLQVRELSRVVATQHDANIQLKARNDALDAEVRDLKTGTDAIDERERSELGMMRQDEVFFQLQPDAPRSGATWPAGRSEIPAAPQAAGAAPPPAAR